MNIEYTAKAKDDLAKIEWKTREKIINHLGYITDRPSTIKLKKMHGSDFWKKSIADHVILCRPSEKADLIQIIAIHKDQRLRIRK